MAGGKGDLNTQGPEQGEGPIDEERGPLTVRKGSDRPTTAADQGGPHVAGDGIAATKTV